MILNIDPTAGVEPNVQSLSGADGTIVFEQAEIEPVSPNLAMPYSTSGWTRFYQLALQNYVTPGTYSRRKCVGRCGFHRSPRMFGLGGLDCLSRACKRGGGPLFYPPTHISLASSKPKPHAARS